MMVKRFVSIWIMLVAALAALAQPVAAQQDRIRAQVAAATNRAMQSLRADIMAARITPTMTVGQFLEAIDWPDALDDVIQRAQQIGGPRWVDDQTCQVRLEVSGVRLAHALVSVAAMREKISPMPARVLEARLEDFRQRTFAATGTSISVERVLGIRPVDAGDAWHGVSDDARSQAVSAARRDAVQHVIDNIRPVPVDSDRTMADLLNREPVRQAVDNWLSERPVTQVQFRDDLQVELAVSAPPDELLDTILNSARAANGDTQLKMDEKTMEQLRREFARRVSAAVGRAGVSTTAPAGDAPLIVELPAQPPSWITELIEAEAVAEAQPKRIFTKSAAEARATEILRVRIGALPLTRTMSIEDAARKDPRILGAINGALLRARTFKTDFRADGSVMVRMTLDARTLWNELTQAVGR